MDIIEIYLINMTHQEEYEKWRKVVEDAFPWFADTLETCLSVTSLLWFDNINLPFALILVGVPAGFKTTVLKCIDDQSLDFVYYTDSFTSKAFVSHVMDKTPENLKNKIDLLPRIKDKVFIVPELAPIFTQDKEKLMQSIGVLTRIFDGQGYKSDSGAHGSRGYQGKYKFMFLAATTPIPYRVWEVMATLGTKMYFLQVPKVPWKREEQVDWFLEDTYEEKMKRATDATTKFLEYLRSRGNVKWNKKNDPKVTIYLLRDLGVLLARLRGKVNVFTKTSYSEADGSRQVTVHTTPIIEDAMRPFIMLHSLACGHAFLRGRTQLSGEDMPYVISVALSSAPRDRIETFKLLLKNGGVLTAKQIVDGTRCSKHTALRAMRTLGILRLAEDIPQTIERRKTTIYLHKDLKWCLENEHMLRWGATRAVKPTRKGRMEEEQHIDGIFDTKKA